MRYVAQSPGSSVWHARIMATHPTAQIAVIGGSGFYTFANDPVRVHVPTPYGDPSAHISVGTVNGVSVAFLPRHGDRHQFPAHKVPYRANMWALRSLGVRQVLAPCAVGGLQPDLGPGTFVVPDQIVDRTSARPNTYYDEGACHVSFADPYCDRLRSHLLDGLAELQPVDGGAMVVIDGPRFSTRAESKWYSDQGFAVINMTGMPEAILARELALCYASVALVTDHDAGVDAETSVTLEGVMQVFASHTDTLKQALADVVASVGERECGCSDALAGLNLPISLP
jgi:5'-methylthioadenosine phosphorylase